VQPDPVPSTDRQPVVYLHIGAMKTGTTFLQGLLLANRDNLATAGYLFPGRRPHDQVRAVRDIMEMDLHDPAMRAGSEGRWAKLAEEMLGYDGRASIFSMEFLSFATTRKAARVIKSLPGADVHVILTVRDALGAIPAQWQTHCRNGGTASWPQFARSARRGARFHRLARGQGARTFQRTQGIPRMLAAWAPALSPGRLHVVTVPPPGSDPLLLWERFASVVGVDPAVCTESAGRTNPSLGQPSADLMRRINTQLGRQLPSDYQPTLKAKLATEILTTRSGLEAAARLDRRTWDFALAWNRRVRDAIASSGATLVGNVDDLPVRPEQSAIEYVDELSDPADEDILLSAATAREGLLQLLQRRTKQVTRVRALAGKAAGEKARKRARRNARRRRAGPPAPERWRREQDPVDAAVSELTSLVREAIKLRRRARKREQGSTRAPMTGDVAFGNDR